MKTLSIEISNILSIEKASLSFDSNGLVLIEGWNYDDNRANGAGKTAIFNALSFALFDDMPRKITASEILRDGTKAGYAKATVDVDGNIYEVTRRRPKGVEFKVNGEVKDLTQSEFESRIRMSYKQFLITSYNAQSNSECERFMDLNDSGKKDFLLKLMNLEDIARCKKIVDASIKTSEAAIAAEKSKMAQAQAKLEAYRESDVDEQSCMDQIAENEQSIQALVAKISANRSVPKPNTAELDSREFAISEKLAKVSQARTKRSMFADEYRRISVKDKPFAGAEACQSCGTKLDISDAKAAHEKHVQEYRAQAKDLKTKLDTLDMVLAKENELQAALTKVRKDRSDQTRDYDRAREIASKDTIHMEKLRNRNEMLQLELARAKTNRTKMQELSKQIAASESVIVQLENKLAIDFTLSIMYSPTGATAYVLDSAVSTFNECVSEYVSMIWPSASYTLRSYKENSSGDLVAKFSEELVIGGKQKSIGSLSGGEARALSLAIDFAVMDVIFKNFNIKANPIIMDEPFDGLDSVGRELVIDLLEKLSADRNIIVVDHVSEAKSMFSKVIRVEKRNGISTIV